MTDLNNNLEAKTPFNTADIKFTTEFTADQKIVNQVEAALKEPKSMAIQMFLNMELSEEIDPDLKAQIESMRKESEWDKELFPAAFENFKESFLQELPDNEKLRAYFLEKCPVLERYDIPRSNHFYAMHNAVAKEPDALIQFYLENFDEISRSIAIKTPGQFASSGGDPNWEIQTFEKSAEIPEENSQQQITNAWKGFLGLFSASVENVREAYLPEEK
ncbi:hypothetical protein HN954_01090 [bacterium]|jgi:hypothetical protein|nr:hypothetical protein [bacterium]MBT6832422.1 hypothetical protein [bacterium]MBT6996006.1 hypothetical protein [bacterium]MBT7772568.1 hypothetical protein [bacterium]